MVPTRRCYPFCRNHETYIDFLQKFCRNFLDSAEFCRILQNSVQFCRFSCSKWVGGSQLTFQQSGYFESISFFIFQIISGCGGCYPQAAIHSAETTEHTLISAEILQKFLGFCRKNQDSAEFCRILQKCSSEMHRWQPTNVSIPRIFWMGLIFCLSNNSVLRWFLPPRCHPFCRIHETYIDFLQKLCRHFPGSAGFCRTLYNSVDLAVLNEWVAAS